MDAVGPLLYLEGVHEVQDPSAHLWVVAKVINHMESGGIYLFCFVLMSLEASLLMRDLSASCLTVNIPTLACLTIE